MTDTVTFDPDCTTCGGTLHPCECHIFGGGDYDGLHPPHGKPFWEWRGLCPDCHEHDWGEPQGSSQIRWCSICRVGREAKGFDDEEAKR